MTAALVERFARSYAAAAGDGAGEGAAAEVGQEVMAAWAEPARTYHGISHLEACLALFDELRGHAERPVEVELALFFHDAVYDTRAVDNEARSEAWARRALGAGGVPRAVIDRVASCIGATRLSAVPSSPDALLMVDIDRAVLGAGEQAFDAYEAGVREEYRWVDPDHYAAARVAVLERFLGQERIFRTDPCADLEAPARVNLRRSITALGGALD